MILGIDEAGRGPWAGPLVVGAVVLGGVEIEGLTDSKKLTKRRRERIYEEIKREAAGYATGWVSATELDKFGMSESLQLATRRAVEQINVPYSEIIIDGTINFLASTGKGKYVKTMAKADLLIPSVSAASVIAKVERDAYMTKLDDTYPGYGFKNHAGYGVARHREAIDRLGVTSEHRLSFAPLAKYGSATNPKVIAKTEAQSTRQVGDAGEDAAARYLQRFGHDILERNWRTKYCEVDIISRKGDTIYFVEVKYRKNDEAGDGLAVITAQKLRQMRFAANFYAHVKYIKNSNLQLVVVSTSGTSPEVIALVEVN